MTNREVFAVPGNITWRNSFGTNCLIKGAGAKLVQQWQDIAAELPPETAARLLPPEPKKWGAGLAERLSRIPEDLTQSERAVYKSLAADTSVHIDALAEANRLPLTQLLSVLLSLKMRDLIRQLPGKCFVRKF